jgi:ABC-2 type transport system ATP-binding protein
MKRCTRAVKKVNKHIDKISFSLQAKKMEKTAVSIKNLSKTYKTGTKALDSINLEIKQGDFFALLGANGAGKTTIIGILTGLVTKTHGDVKVFNYNLDTQLNSVKNSIGVVPQEFNFNMFEKVLDIVVRQGQYYGMTYTESKTNAEEILKKLELWEKRGQKSMELSGGMKRRLMIARALIHSPKLLILDEPTAGVDVELRRGMWDYLKTLNTSGTTILLTTHYLEEVEELCKNTAIIKDGQIVINDKVSNLLNKMEDETFVIQTDKDPKLKTKIQSLIKLDSTTLEFTTNKKNTLQKAITEISKSASILSIKPKGNRLENLFLNLLKK